MCVFELILHLLDGVCQILRENKPKERNGYSRRDCAGLEVGGGRARDGRIERDGCCVTDAPLSLTHK